MDGSGMGRLELSQAGAQSIVEEIGAVVHQNINLMDCDGRVLASTDRSRCGSIHEGVRRMLEEGKTELYVTEGQATATSRQGLNLAIVRQGCTAGVIGITGAYEEVAGYGQVVKRMVEILIREREAQDQRRLRRRAVLRFLEDWLLTGGDWDSQGLSERGLRLGIDVTLPRRVMAVGRTEVRGPEAVEEEQAFTECLEQTLEEAVAAGGGGLVFPQGECCFLLVPAQSEQRMEQLAEQLRQLAEGRTGRSLSVGIDGQAEALPEACLQAARALRSAKRTGTRILSYGKATLELLTGEISGRLQEEYLRKLFPGESQEALCRWASLLEAYFSAEGSLQEAARRLHIHKNTLTYRLRRLEERTGFDVRRPSQSAVFYMAMLFLRNRR